MLLNSSRLAMGTVELGIPYGFGGTQPSRKSSIELLHQAYDAGISMYDTAPNYGVSEEIVGEAFRGEDGVVIATKVPDEIEQVEASIEQSLLKFSRDVLDIVQIHNATEESLYNSDVLEQLHQLKKAGVVREVGASVYGEAAALAAIHRGVDVIQIAFNVLDQRMLKRVIPLAEVKGVRLFFRSIYLKGVLTERGRKLQSELTPLREMGQRVVDRLDITWISLAEYALRFALSVVEKQSKGHVLLGLSNISEFNYAVAVEQKRVLSEQQLNDIHQMAIEDERWLDPSLWPKADQLMG